MFKGIKAFVTVTLMAGILASVADAGPIRDRIKALREKRAGGSAASAMQAITLSYQGVDRRFFVYIPDAVAGQSNVPAVMTFHGGGGDAEGIQQSSDMALMAQDLGFIAIFPEVVTGQWNDGRAESASSYDDVGFVRAIIANDKSLFGVSVGQVFAAGLSNGGMFTQRLSCDAADLFSAVAIVSANMPADYQGACNPSRSVPKIFFNGVDDPIMPYTGGEIRSLKVLGLGAGGQVLSVPQTQEFWRQMDGCSAGVSQSDLPDVADDGTTVSVTTYANCSGSTQLKFVAIDGGGHSWPGADERPRRMAGKTSQDISATDEMISFFASYGL